MAIHQMHGLLAASRTCKLITLLTKTIGAWNVSIHKKIKKIQFECNLLHFSVAPTACDGSGTTPVTAAPPATTAAPASSTCDISDMFGPNVNGGVYRFTLTSNFS